MYLALWLIRRWRLPATPILILPVAVSLKRFLTPLLVLSLGIFVSFVRRGNPLAARRYPTATACLSAGPLVFQRSGKGAPIEAEARPGKQLPGKFGAVTPKESASPLDADTADQFAHVPYALFGRDLRAGAA